MVTSGGPFVVAPSDPAAEITQHGSEDTSQATTLHVPQAQWFFPVLKGRTQGFAGRDSKGDRLSPTWAHL